MRKLAFIPLGALFGVLMFAIPAGAGATQTHDGTLTLSGFQNQCTGVIGTVDETYHEVLLDKVNPIGSFHQTETWNGKLTFTPDPTLFPNALSFTGTFHNSDVINSPYNAGYTETYHLTVNGHFSDGSHGVLQELIHVTYNANGTLTADISGLNCSSG